MSDTQPQAIKTPSKLANEDIVIVRSSAQDLPDEYVQQLVDKSRQDHIMKYEGHEDVGTDENPGRFRSIEDFRNWSSGKQRTIYLMTTPADDQATPDVGGIIWFGPRENEHAPGATLTFGIRHYTADEAKGWGEYLGKGYGTPFMAATHKDIENEYPEDKVWLDVVEGNDAGYFLYKKLGYEEIDRVVDEEHPERKRIVMIYNKELAPEVE